MKCKVPNSPRYCTVMELRQLVPIEVKTLDKTKPSVTRKFVPHLGDLLPNGRHSLSWVILPNLLKVTLGLQDDGTLDSDEILKKVCQTLGLESGSIHLFSLFEGNAKLHRRIRDIDDVPNPPPELSLRKWCFNPKVEKKVIDKDDVAAHLMFCEAQYELETGKFSPTKEQEQKLDELADPGFPLARQYVTLCHSVKNYFSVEVKRCGMCHGPAAGFVHSQASEIILDVRISCEGLALDTGQSGQFVQIPLYCISKWSSHPTNGWLQYHYCSSTEQDRVISLVSPQSQYIMAATNEIMKEVQGDDTCFYSSMITTTPDGATMWENATFDVQRATQSSVVFLF